MVVSNVHGMSVVAGNTAKIIRIFEAGCSNEDKDIRMGKPSTSG